MVHIIDCETTGLKHSHGDRAFAIGYSDENEDSQVLYKGIDFFDAVVHINDTPLIEWANHNIGFDLPFLASEEINLNGTLHDTMIAAHVYNNIEPFKDLASLATKYCGIPNTEDVALDKWFKDNGYNADNKKYIDVPLEIMTPYVHADIRRTLALFKFYQGKGILNEPAYKLEMDLVPIVARIAARGMHVDVTQAKCEFDKAADAIAQLERRALQNFGVENLGSSQQIAEALFTRGGLVCITKTAKGNICLDEAALGKYTHPLVDIVLQHRQISKIAGTYLTAILEKSRDSRLFCSLNQVGARTGRFSSSDPNLQNIPRNDETATVNIRKVFVCPPKYKLLSIDLSQIELRILAHYSKEPAMIETLRDRKGDIHTTTAIQMFGEVNNELRTVAKTLNFAVIYGAGGEALVEQLNKALPNKKILLAQAKDFKAKFFRGYPLVQQFLWDVQRRIGERGFVSGKSGRRYYCEKDKAYRASNYLIQGESAMLMKRMMVDVETYLADKHTRLINVIHDEMLFDLHEDEEHIVPFLMAIIERSDVWRVPIFANAAISDTSWAEKRKLT